MLRTPAPLIGALGRTIMQSLSIPSPDGKHTATFQYSGEIRFGPCYFTLNLDGEIVAEETFGEEARWSEDSRYLAVQQWLTTKESDGPQTALVCFDLVRRRRCCVSTARNGFIVPKRFEGELLIYTKQIGIRKSEYEIAFESLPRWQPVQ